LPQIAGLFHQVFVDLLAVLTGLLLQALHRPFIPLISLHDGLDRQPYANSVSTFVISSWGLCAR
jgi:hypothetical protein